MGSGGFWLGLGGFRWVRVGSGGFGWVTLLVTTYVQSFREKYFHLNYCVKNVTIGQFRRSIVMSFYFASHPKLLMSIVLLLTVNILAKTGLLYPIIEEFQKTL